MNHPIWLYNHCSSYMNISNIIPAEQTVNITKASTSFKFYTSIEVQAFEKKNITET